MTNKFEYYRGINDINGNGWVVFIDSENNKFYYGQYITVCNIVGSKKKQYQTVKKDLLRIVRGYERMGYEPYTNDEIRDLTKLV